MASGITAFSDDNRHVESVNDINIVVGGDAVKQFDHIQQSKKYRSLLDLNLILARRVGISEFILHDLLLLPSLKRGEIGKVIFLTYPPYKIREEREYFERSLYLQHYSRKWKDKRLLVEMLLKNLPLDKRIIFLFDSLQMWDEENEYLIRFLLEQSVFSTIRLWIHAPLYLIPEDLLSAIGTVLILFPSPKESDLLTRLLPSEKGILGEFKRFQGLFIHTITYPGQWDFRDLNSQLDIEDEDIEIMYKLSYEEEE